MGLVYLQRKGRASLSYLSTEDLEAFVESEQDRGLKPLSVRGRLHQIYAFLRYGLDRGMVPADVLARRIRIKVPEALPRAMDAEDVKRFVGRHSEGSRSGDGPGFVAHRDADWGVVADAGERCAIGRTEDSARCGTTCPLTSVGFMKWVFQKDRI